MKIRVPATSANLGCGFDSCGIALSLYLHLDTGVEADVWQIEHSLAGVSHDESNLIISTALKLKPDLQPRKMTMQTDIPPARGLGSSSTAIVAGIELANREGQLGLTRKEKLAIATEIEGHPDNVGPAIYGDFVVACYDQSEVNSVKHHFPDCDVVVFIPNQELLTSESRDILPKTLPYKEAVTASGISNVMIGAVLNGNLPLAGKMMEQDLWHEKYRGELIPHLKPLRDVGHDLGVYGTVLSGAGPTILTLCPYELTDKFVNEVKALGLDGKVEILAVDKEGTQVY
ncbi:homoserine kinase [uncultured Vagococcus sp.]|uniref:homoserine kinase n=1 Tax=uncultured Vagococcus sp. TaxID=189676 RepID=UPI0028D28B22|nr:homoserine kinase [uncultured Vagococcus sp.]